MAKGATYLEDGYLLEALSRLRSRLRQEMDRLARSELNMLQAAIVEELLSGQRTVAELVATVYSVDTNQDGYITYYSRIRREIRLMESKGLVVSRKAFGRDKPYSLTQLAIARLTRMEGVRPASWKAVPRKDLVLYAAVLGAGSILAWMATVGVEHPVRFLALAFAFVFAGGIAFCRFIESIGRVT
jgi:hypothetical protein